MEYVEGPNLDQVISGLGPMRLQDALVVLEQIANALAYAHGINVIHRDLKPTNIMLRNGDVRQVKVIDFGLARMVTGETLSRLTAEGQMLGSPFYMAPEQAAGDPNVAPAADIYALAGVAYTLLSGKPVFPLTSAIELIAAHELTTPQRLSERCLNIPSLLDELLFACLAKRPESRPRADEVLSHLAKLARKIADVGLGDTSPIPNASVRKATMMQPHRSLLDSELARIVKQPPKDDGSGIGDALMNQAIAVVSELAAALSIHDPEVAQLKHEVERTTASIDELEMELVLLESRLDEVDRDERADIERERRAIVEQLASLRTQMVDARYRLAAKVDGMRASADGEARKLFAEVDDVLVQLRSVSGSMR
jgi:serine/threonine protein kinase